MKPRCFGFALVFALMCCLLPARLRADERILSFDSHIVVNDNGSMQVTETITVQAEGDQIKHGIYRDFPTSYKDFHGTKHEVGFDIVSLRRDGNSESYHTSDKSNGVRVYFGKSETILAPGKYTYEFVYSTSRQLGFFKDHDELYWNVNGLGWDFPIDVVTATVVLPRGVRNNVTALEGYTGYEGEKGQAFTASRDEDNNPVYRAEAMEAHQGLTIVVSWKKDLIQPPTRQEDLERFEDKNRGAILGLGGLIVLLLYYIIVWVAVGRDPAAGTIVPLYEPPADLSPAAMRFLENMKFDAKTFTVGVLSLAAKGYLTIKQVDRHTYQLIRKEGWGVAEQKLAGAEKTLARKLFENGDKLDLVQSNHTQLQEAKKALQLALHGGMETRYFVTNRQFLWPGFAITAVTVGTALLIGHGPGAPVAIFMSIWLTGWTAGVVALVHNVIAAWRSVRTESWLEAPGALFLTVFSLPFLAGEGFGIFVLSMSSGVPAVVVVLCAVFLNALFHHLLKSPTRLGRQLMDKAEGFTLFLKAVEGPQLNAAPPTTPETFERYLPYAVAMGVEHAWSQKFAHDLAVAGLAPQGGGYSPSWYSGSGFNAGSASDFTSSFSNSFSSAVSSASSSPSSSSGSSGGGSSGGGGGGGGGGGW